MKTIGIIPSRYASSRFPGKPLADIGGKPMLWHVYQAASNVSEIDAVYIATEDKRIAQACADLSLPCLMTRDDHITGTDRLAECIKLVEGDYFVNIQGDEPKISPCAVSAVVRAMLASEDPTLLATNGYAMLTDATDVMNTNVVKVVTSASGRAMYYSRSPIPHPKAGHVDYKRQLGLYCFARRGLELFGSLKPGPVERAETVEMLRFVEHGLGVLMVEVEDDSIPVDTPQDLDRVRKLFAASY